MTKRKLQLLIDAESDKQRLDVYETLRELDDNSYKRWCKFSSFICQAKVEKAYPNFRRGFSNILWDYSFFYGDNPSSIITGG